MMTGWAAVRYGHKSSVREAHVIPLGDKAMHTIPICWCSPRIEDRRIHVHNALDGRP